MQLPKTEAGAISDRQEPLTISVRADGTIFVQAVETPFAELAPKMRALAGSRLGKPVYVRADGRAPYAVVAQVMASLSQSGFTIDRACHRHRRPFLGLDQPANARRALRSPRRADRYPAMAGVGGAARGRPRVWP